MTTPAPHPPGLDWHSLEDKERLVWAVAFVAGDRAGEVGVEAADAMVEKLRASGTTPDSTPVSAADPNGEPPLQRVFDALFSGIESTKKAKPGADRSLQPINEALASGAWITPEEFEAWYPVAYRIAMRGSSSSDRPTKEDIARAMDAFAMGRSDFF